MTAYVVARVADHEHLGVGEQRFHARAHQRRDVRDLLLDIPAVGADEPSHGNVPVEDSDVTALADQGLDEHDHRALSQIVGSGLEGQADHPDPLPSCREHGLCAPTHLRLVRWQDRREQGQRDVGSAGRVEERSEVFRQARASECEPRTEVGFRDVQLAVHQEDPHDFVGIRAERRARVGDLVRETHLEGVERVRGVLDHLSGPNRRMDERGLDALVEHAQERCRGGVAAPHEREGGAGEVGQ